MALQPSRLILHSRTVSRSCARVRIAASLKNIPLEIVDHGPGRGAHKLYNDPDYLKKNPGGTIPTLEAHYGNGESLFLTQSLSMLEFLDETYSSGTRLIPPMTDMAARCKVRDLAYMVACDVQPLQSSRVYTHLKYLSSDPEVLARSYKDSTPHINGKETHKKMLGQWNHRVLKGSMRVYEAIAQKSAGKFSVGDNVSIADICLVVLIQTINRFGKQFDETTGHPTIARIMRTCEGIDAFRDHGVPSRSIQEQGSSQSDPATTATSQPSLGPGSTKSQEDSLETGSSTSVEEVPSIA